MEAQIGPRTVELAGRARRMGVSDGLDPRWLSMEAWLLLATSRLIPSACKTQMLCGHGSQQTTKRSLAVGRGCCAAVQVANRDIQIRLASPGIVAAL